MDGTSIIFTNLSVLGNYAEETLQRVGKGTDVTKLVREKLFPHYKDRYHIYIYDNNHCQLISSENAIRKPTMGHRRANWEEQLRVGVQDVKV